MRGALLTVRVEVRLLHEISPEEDGLLSMPAEGLAQSRPSRLPS